MRRTIGVHVGDEPMRVGVLYFDRQGARESAAFQYDPAWLGRGARFALEPGLPLVAGPQFHRKVGSGSVFHAAIADTEPDGWGKRVTLRDHAKRRQEARQAGEDVDRRPLDSLDCLLAVDDALRHHGISPAEDIEELWRRIAFSILITNVDDHLKNHGFLHVDRGLWRLAPAFDINPFPDRVRELKTWVSEDTGPDATIKALTSVLPYFRIAPARARAILAEVEASVSRWRAEGRALGMDDHQLEAFADAFEHREREAARAVAG